MTTAIPIGDPSIIWTDKEIGNAFAKKQLSMIDLKKNLIV